MPGLGTGSRPSETRVAAHERDRQKAVVVGRLARDRRFGPSREGSAVSGRRRKRGRESVGKARGVGLSELVEVSASAFPLPFKSNVLPFFSNSIVPCDG